MVLSQEDTLMKYTAKEIRCSGRLERCLLARGSRASFYKVDLRNANSNNGKVRIENKVALKKFNENYGQELHESFDKQKAVLELRKEATLLKALCHENIVQLVGFCTDDAYFGLLLELCEGGTLRNLLSTHERDIPLTTMINWASQIAEGMAYLTRQGYANGYLRTNNVLINEQVCFCNSTRPICPRCGLCGLDCLTLKLTGFGVPKKLGTEEPVGPVERYCWLAPETLKRILYTEASDVWAFGVVLWEIQTRFEPFELCSSLGFYFVIEESCKPFPTSIDCPADWKTIMEACWKINPFERPTFENIVDFFEKYSAKDNAVEAWVNTEDVSLMSTADISLKITSDEQLPDNHKLIDRTSKNQGFRKIGAFFRRLMPNLEFLKQGRRIGRKNIRDDVFESDVTDSDCIPVCENELHVQKEDNNEVINVGIQTKEMWSTEKFDENIGLVQEIDTIQIPNNETLMNYRSAEITKDDDISLGDCRLGGGATADVYEMNIPTGKIALKKFVPGYAQKRHGKYSRENAVMELMKEAVLLNRLSHVNVVQLVGYCIEDPYFGLLMELCQGGSLGQLSNSIHDKGISLQVITMINWVNQIAKGMEYMTRNGFVHRDLKADNSGGKNEFSNKTLVTVLVKERVCFCNSSGPVCPKCGLCGLDSLTLKMTDFGETRRQETVSTKHLVGTYGFMAPEMYRYQRYTEASDVWAFGVIHWEILTGKPPIQKEENIHPHVLAFQTAQNGQMLPIDANCPKEWRVVMKKCWEFDPSKRPKFSELVKYFENYTVLAKHMKSIVQPRTLNTENIRSVTLNELLSMSNNLMEQDVSKLPNKGAHGFIDHKFCSQ